MCAIEQQLIQAVTAKIHEYRLGGGNLDQLIEDIREFAVTYRSRDPQTTEELHAAWRKLATTARVAEPASFATDAHGQAAIYDVLDTIARLIGRL